MKYLVLLLILVVGCRPVCEPEIQIKETIKYKDQVVEKTVYLNKTCEIEPLYNDTSEYVLNLIRQVKWCETKLQTNWSYIELEDKLRACNDSLNTLKNAYDTIN